MAKVDTTGLDIAIAQYEERIAFEIANPFDGTMKARSVPYCFLPDKVRARVENGQADFIEEVTKLLAAAKRAKAGA